jgi:hypothetical protein
MEKLIKSIFISFIFILSQAHALDIRGYSIGQVVFDKENTKGNTDTVSAYRVQNINRFNFFQSTGSSSSAELGFEINQSFDHVYTSYAKVDYESANRPYRIDSLTPTFVRSNRYGDKSYIGFANFDRLMFNYSNNGLQMNIGRQPIYFGISKTANPLDVLTPFSLTQINTEERQGIDAIRVRYPIGIMGQWDAGLVFGDDFDADKSSAFLNAKFNIKGYEFGPLIQRYSDASLFGLEVIKDYKGANLYVEAAYSDPDSSSDYFRSTLGAERLITPEFTLALEYHHNGAGGSDDLFYTDVNPFAVTVGGVTFLGKNYLNGYGYYQITGVDTLAALIYFNLGDRSTLIAPTYIRSMSDNQELNVGAFVGLGKRSNFSNVVVSEFGSAGTSVFAKYKFFF